MSSFFKDEQPLPPEAAGSFVSRLGPAVGSEGTSRVRGHQYTGISTESG